MIAVDTAPGRRRPAEVTAPMAGSVKSTGAQLVAAFPPRPVAASWPATEARRSAVLDRVLAAPFALDNPNSQRNRRLGVLAVLGWLRDAARRQLAAAVAGQRRRGPTGLARRIRCGRRRGRDGAGAQLPHLSPGLLVLICAEVIRPSLDWLLRFAPARRGLAAEMARTRDRRGVRRARRAVHPGRVGQQSGQQALTRIAVILAAKGGPVAAVRVGDCVELLQIAARHARHLGEGTRTARCSINCCARTASSARTRPAAIEMFSGRGQPSCEQLIDRYRIACRPVRDVLVDYLRERQPAVDFSTLQRLAYLLGKLFWADLEAHHPGIDSLHLPRDVAAAWKQRATAPAGHHRHHGSRQITGPRLDGRSVLTPVRAFYLDLAQWAVDDPARWGPWAAPCPVSAATSPTRRTAPPQVPDGPPHPRTTAGAADAGRLGGRRTRPHRRAARRRRADPTRRAFTAAGATLRRAVLRPRPPAASGPRTPTPGGAATSASTNTAGSGPGP